MHQTTLDEQGVTLPIRWIYSDPKLATQVRHRGLSATDPSRSRLHRSAVYRLVQRAPADSIPRLENGEPFKSALLQLPYGGQPRKAATNTQEVEPAPLLRRATRHASHRGESGANRAAQGESSTIRTEESRGGGGGVGR